METKHNYIFTRHLRERYCERIIQMKIRDIDSYLTQNCRKLDGILNDRLSRSKKVEDSYALKMFKTMHSEDAENTFYLLEGKTIFVCVNVNGTNVIRTCFNNKGPIGFFTKNLTY